MSDNDGGKNGGNDIESLGFEAALQELEGIVERLEQGQGSLDDAIAAYERGAALKQHCQKKLDEARMKVERIRVPEAGAPSETEAFDT
ncbi:MAG: exodeoxyribonuclease VII small subunit [Rhodospirillaceae bacterium]|nr:exodeoxyribonuclease VII small subunit [Rhodospirillaceae bacterium]MBT6139903.1 exodeoxyribonuclease VII small subunit [Rhodospirillaceae bacterium]